MPIHRSTTLLAILASVAAAPAAAHAAPVWTPPENISTQSVKNVTPLIDVTPSGESVVAAREDVGSGRRGFRVGLRSPGGSFSSQVLPPNGSDQVTPADQAGVDLAADGEGIVAWSQSNGLFYALRSPGGAFGAPQQVPGTQSAGIGSVAVGLDGSGNATFLWTTLTGSPGSQTTSVYSIVRRADGVFVDAQTLASVPALDFEFALQNLSVNDAGVAVATWREVGPTIGSAYYVLRDGALALFGAPTIAVHGSAIDGAVDTAGDTAIVLSTIGGLWVQYKSAGGALGPVVKIGSTNSAPDLALASDGMATVVWETAQGSDNVVMVCSFTTAGCLHAPETVAVDPLAALSPHVAVSSSGATVFMWSSDPFGSAATVRARTRSAAGSWGPEQTAGALGSSWGDVGIDDSGNVVGTWLFQAAGTTYAQVASLDVVPPSLGTVDVPSRVTAGTPMPVSATASDNIGPVSLSWDFGDGATASASPATHTYSSAGTRTITITATDASGNAISQTRTVTIDPAPIVRPVGLAFTTLPRLSNRRFRVGVRRTAAVGRAAAARKRIKVGTAFSYGLNRAATVSITIHAIRLHVRPMTLTRSSHGGANRVMFSGRLGKRVLRPGRYHVTFVARAGGATTKPVTISFTVVAA